MDDITPTDLELAYAAGLFDGEGCIYVHPRKCYPYLHVQMADREPLDFLQRIFGGKIYPKKAQRSHHRPTFQWQLCGDAARKAASLMYPFFQLERKKLNAAAINWCSRREAQRICAANNSSSPKRRRLPKSQLSLFKDEGRMAG